MLIIHSSRAHIIRDLRPYICTYEDCLNSEQLYDTRDDWIQHESSTHQTIFQCSQHEAQRFTTLAAYQAHRQTYHPDDPVSSFSAPLTISNTHQSCPVCSIDLGSMQKLQSHIALHLERFAMFSLPRSIDGAEGSEHLSNRSTGGTVRDDNWSTAELDAIDSNQHLTGQPLYGNSSPSPADCADQDLLSSTLCVGNLPLDAPEEGLKATFSKQQGYKRLNFEIKHDEPVFFVEFEAFLLPPKHYANYMDYHYTTA